MNTTVIDLIEYGNKDSDDFIFRVDEGRTIDIEEISKVMGRENFYKHGYKTKAFTLGFRHSKLSKKDMGQTEFESVEYALGKVEGRFFYHPCKKILLLETTVVFMLGEYEWDLKRQHIIEDGCLDASKFSVDIRSFPYGLEGINTVVVGMELDVRCEV